MKNNETHLENNEKSLKYNEQHLENEKSLNAVPDFLKGIQDWINKVRMPPRFLRRYAFFSWNPCLSTKVALQLSVVPYKKKTMNNIENHRQNNEKPMKTNGSTHDEKK